MTTKDTVSKDKDPRGRPSKYNPDFCIRIVQMAKQGLSMYEIAEAFDVTIDCMNKWAQENPDFEYAKNRAREYYFGKLIRTGRENFLTEGFNTRTFELLYNSAAYRLNNTTIKNMLKKAKDAEDKCQVIIDGILDGEILPAKSETIINTILRLTKMDQEQLELIKKEVEKQLSK